jgi:MFS family permease
VSYAILAGTGGALVAGTLSDKLGRRLTILISDLFLLVGPLFLSISFGPISLCVGRLITGVGLGISMMVAPVFLSECSPLALRGQIVSSYFFMQFVGLILSYLSGIMFPAQLFSMFGLGVIPAIAQLLMMCLSQYEPALFLAKRGNMIHADKQLRSFYSFNNEDSVRVRRILTRVLFFH